MTGIISRMQRGGQIGVNAAAKLALSHVTPESRRMAERVDQLEAAGKKLSDDSKK